MSKRPWCCANPKCAPIFHGKASDYADISKPEPGQSYICFGRMEKTIEFTYDGVLHPNDLHTCLYTPLKGLVAFQMNIGDWDFFATMFRRAKEKLLDISEPHRKALEAPPSAPALPTFSGNALEATMNGQRCIRKPSAPAKCECYGGSLHAQISGICQRCGKPAKE